MCGIAGILRLDGAPVDTAVLDTVLLGLAHRGQDHHSIEAGSARETGRPRKLSRTSEIALGHRRLSVIDLSDAASQPMASEDGQHWIVYNGEIYNYIELREELRRAGCRFRTESDTEVVLQAYRVWGEEFVSRLNGMFALALWDETRRRLFCARDHLGIKPFYFHRSASHFAFASESRALHPFHGNRLDREGLAAYLLSLYVPADMSVFAGVAKLPPAHVMSVTGSGELNLRRYWRPTGIGAGKDDARSRQELETALESAIRRQLRSDVPVGALLSAGVDSGMVVALAAKQRPGLHTYSIGFEGHGVNELPAAQTVARTYGTTHHEALVSDGDSMRYLDRTLARMSEPIADPSIVPSYILSEMAAGDGVKVLLSGTGGDEIFGGYLRYAGGDSLQRRILSRVPQPLRGLAGSLWPATGKLGARLRNPDFDMLFSTGGSFELFASAMPDEGERGKFFSRLAASFPQREHDSLPLLYRQMTFDLGVYLPDEILYLFDQMSMAHTVEGRVPLIDIEVVEAALRFPARSHVRGNRTKVLFRELAESRLGREHVWRAKHGFTGPVQWWVNRHREQFFEAAASLPAIPGLEQFDVAPLLRLRADSSIGARDADALFIAYVLAGWYRGMTGHA
jgi:asparagine synthase (glutamine-hydrolysing)